MENDDFKQAAWVGVDPGKTGAYAVLRENGTYEIETWEDEYVFVEAMAHWKSLNDIHLAAVESVHSMPKQGISSAFTFGTTFGLIRGVLAATKIHIELVTPLKWQKAMLRNDEGPDTKIRSITAARRIFPDIKLKKTQHGKSDAILLALYARRFL